MFAEYFHSGYKKPAGSKGAGNSLAMQPARDYLWREFGERLHNSLRALRPRQKRG